MSDERMEKLIALSTSDDGLDWKTLENIDKLAWGIGPCQQDCPEGCDCGDCDKEACGCGTS